VVHLRYKLHAFARQVQQRQQEQDQAWRRRVGAVAAVFLILTGVVLVQRHERERDRQRALDQAQVAMAERALRIEAGRLAEAERQLLEQQLAAQAAEQKALELKSQLYASIGIMAGSYAHNIKNLLVRPNDLLRRCLEADTMSSDQAAMLQEVRQTLGMVTDRLQQILRTVRRDPGRSEQALLDLNLLLREVRGAWTEVARDKWKLEVEVEEGPGPLWVAGDASHLVQAVENLLCNARDATFEMRNHLRTHARQQDGDESLRRQALIAAAAWRGRVTLRACRQGGEVLLEVTDNGIGMTDEVKRRCTETHFSTKRENALYEGNNTGMGLGLAFVVTILEHHRARLEIESEPLRGTTLRARFPAATPAPAVAATAKGS
jgi:signal transduction histidine kinase